MERDSIRLECLKIAASKTADHAEALKRAEDYFKFITEPIPRTQSNFAVGEKPTKHIGTTKPF